MELSESQVTCLLAIADNPELDTTANLAAASGLDKQEAEDVMLELAEQELIRLTYTSMALDRRGREAVRQIRVVLEKRRNEDQLKK